MAILQFPATTSEPTPRDNIQQEFQRAFEFFDSCEEQGADLTLARIKLGEAERTFIRATGDLEERMLKLAVTLVKQAKHMAYQALLLAATAKVAKIESYVAEGYSCPVADRLVEQARSAIQRGEAFRAIYFASRAMSGYEELVSELTKPERQMARHALTAAKQAARANREKRKLENAERADRQGAGKQHKR